MRFIASYLKILAFFFLIGINKSLPQENKPEEILIGNYMDSLASLYDKNMYDSAYRYSIKVLSINEDLQVDSIFHEALMYQGNIHLKNKQMELAFDTYNKSTEIAINLKDTTRIIRSTLATGDAILKQVNPQKPDSVLLDSAYVYFNLAENLETKHPSSTLVPLIYESLAHIHFLSERHQEARKFYDLSIEKYLNIKDSLRYINVLLNRTNLDILNGEFREAEKDIRSGLQYFRNTENDNGVMYTYQLLVYLFENEENYKEAYQYYQKQIKIEQELFDLEKSNKIAELNSKYNFEKSQNKLIEQKTRHEKTQFWLIFISILLIALATIFWLSMVRHNLKQKNLTLQHKEQQLLQQSRLEQLESESQNNIINATLDGREEERKAIAETLHNSVSALLSSANLHLHALKRNLTDERLNQILKTQGIIVEASGKIRDLSHNLVSSLLINFGLEYALVDICEKLSNPDLEFSIDSNLEHRYETNTELKIYHMMEELCNNILKHSKASRAEIELFQSPTELRIYISDDGVGFDTSRVEKTKSGIGLNQIEARIKNMKGSFQVKSAINQGTEIFISFPLVPIEIVKE